MTVPSSASLGVFLLIFVVVGDGEVSRRRLRAAIRGLIRSAIDGAGGTITQRLFDLLPVADRGAAAGIEGIF